MAEIENTSLGEHDVEVQLLAQPFPQFEGVLVQMSRFIPEVVGANDGGIASGVAATYPTFFEHGDIGYAVFFGQIVGGRNLTATATDDDGFVAPVGRRISQADCQFGGSSGRFSTREKIEYFCMAAPRLDERRQVTSHGGGHLAVRPPPQGALMATKLLNS